MGPWGSSVKAGVGVKGEGFLAPSYPVCHQDACPELGKAQEEEAWRGLVAREYSAHRKL